jgi:hypothetical protein
MYEAIAKQTGGEFALPTCMSEIASYLAMTTYKSFMFFYTSFFSKIPYCNIQRDCFLSPKNQGFKSIIIALC